MPPTVYLVPEIPVKTPTATSAGATVYLPVRVSTVYLATMPVFMVPATVTATLAEPTVVLPSLSTAKLPTVKDLSVFTVTVP